MSAPSSLELLAGIAPVSDEEAVTVFGEAGPERLLEAITRLSPGDERPASHRRYRRPIAIALAAVALAAATGAGWALTRGNARETTAVDCMIDGGTTVIDATSGDPAADCAAVWPAPVPALQAYDDGSGGVVVIPRRQKAPTGWTPIASQDVALIILQESLDDHIDGLASACFDLPAAKSFARRQLDEVGFGGWTIGVRQSSPGAGLCYAGLAEPQTKTLTLMSSGGQAGSPSWPPRRLANSLRPLTQECLSLPAMRSQVEQRASHLGMSRTVQDARNYVLDSSRDDTMRCASVRETVAGTTHVIVRGPAAP